MATRICPICRSSTDSAMCSEDKVPTVAVGALDNGEDFERVRDQLVGRYDVKQLIGRGGMGCVYEAVQVSFGRRVALKVIDRRYASDLGQIERVYTEARAASRLEHPNTIRVYDFGVTDDGIPFMAMELLSGETLRAKLRREGTLLEADAIKICRSIASALIEAHHAAVVHRDLKPQNIFLKRVMGAGEVVKVCDFGIARLLHREGEEHNTLTQEGVMVGTPRYMAPEQAGLGKKIGPWSDLYALGTLLYVLVTGTPPFRAPTPHEVVLAKLRSPAPRLPPTGPRGVISPELRAIVDALLIRDPDARPSDTAEVYRWLTALDEGRPDEVPRRALERFVERCHADDSDPFSDRRRFTVPYAEIVDEPSGTMSGGWPSARADETRNLSLSRDGGVDDEDDDEATDHLPTDDLQALVRPDDTMLDGSDYQVANLRRAATEAAEDRGRRGGATPVADRGRLRTDGRRASLPSADAVVGSPDVIELSGDALVELSHDTVMDVEAGPPPVDDDAAGLALRPTVAAFEQATEEEDADAWTDESLVEPLQLEHHQRRRALLVVGLSLFVVAALGVLLVLQKDGGEPARAAGGEGEAVAAATIDTTPASAAAATAPGEPASEPAGSEQAPGAPTASEAPPTVAVEDAAPNEQEAGGEDEAATAAGAVGSAAPQDVPGAGAEPADGDAAGEEVAAAAAEAQPTPPAAAPAVDAAKVEGLERRGDAARRAGRLRHALELYEEALALAPDRASLTRKIAAIKRIQARRAVRAKKGAKVAPKKPAVTKDGTAARPSRHVIIREKVTPKPPSSPYRVVE